MKLLIIDTETADDENTPCEIAATLYEVGETSGAVASISTLLPVEFNNAQTINRISPTITQAAHPIYKSALAFLREMAALADYAVAFNAEFDSDVVNKFFPNLISVPWLCAMRDFNWGYHSINSHGGYKLTDLALWMGIGISTVHRAGDDVRLLVECLNRHQNLPKLVEDAIALAQSPMVEIKALVSYEDRHLASKAKFVWDGERKIWHKSIRQCLLEDFVGTLDFDVSIV
ncbi:3'-5' exonuclease [Nostoc sp. FACHB-87]|uniref:3'-5' exonuclease n=1 Tax=Nostocaceae TaxID=1162 RepID=UPI001686968B|nr:MULTISPECIES: 3'-5' exonuclease [Nostocaceae]MBD2458346.1 3'-5' exonuclease [Nostoc sp. FACHB-87]MBD2479343.1 3'-5' exonuclease [Anabaena sp. FACHB-83]